jgi:hypothetical protein
VAGNPAAFENSDDELALKSLSEVVETGRWNSIESKFS